MITWNLKRELQEGNAIWGRLSNNDGLKFFSIENAEDCIEPGVYACRRDHYYRGDYETFEIICEGRDRLLFHGANYASQLEGCIAPGKSRGRNKEGLLAVWSSKKAHKEYMDSLEGVDGHLLVISDLAPDPSSVETIEEDKTDE